MIIASDYGPFDDSTMASRWDLLRHPVARIGWSCYPGSWAGRSLAYSKDGMSSDPNPHFDSMSRESRTFKSASTAIEETMDGSKAGTVRPSTREQSKVVEILFPGVVVMFE